MSRQWTARFDCTFSCVVTVDADSEEEAIRKFKSGDWTSDMTDGLVDWDDPYDVEETT